MHKLASGDYRHMGWTIRAEEIIAPSSTGRMFAMRYRVGGEEFTSLRKAQEYIESKEKEIFEGGLLLEGEVAQFCPTCGMQQPTDTELKIGESVEPRCWGGAPCDVCRTPQ